MDRLSKDKYTRIGITSFFLYRYVSEIESDQVGEYTRTRKVLAELGITNPSVEDMSALRYICECVSRRAGFMASAGITQKAFYSENVVRFLIRSTSGSPMAPRGPGWP